MDYNWIPATCGKDVILVRQDGAGSSVFVDGACNRYHVSELDFTKGVPVSEPQADELRRIFNENNERFARQQIEHQEILNRLLSSMDAKELADHNAEIAEREYYRKLRGDIMMEVLRQCDGNINFLTIGETVKKLFWQVHSQDADFFMEG